MEKLKTYFLNQCRTASPWYGIIGLGFLALDINAAWVFAALIIIPNDIVEGWVSKLTTQGADAVESGINAIEEIAKSIKKNFENPSSSNEEKIAITDDSKKN